MSPSWAQVRHDLVSAWRHPGTRLGLWTHFTTPFSGTVFVMLWGYPFLVSGEGLTIATTGTLFTVLVVVGMVAAPFIGEAVARHPLRRSWLVLGIVGSAIVVWTAVLAWPGPAPLWLLLALVVVLALGGPASMIGFDYARTFNPPHRYGTASGIVNVGGFVSALVTILLIGIVLDLTGQRDVVLPRGLPRRPVGAVPHLGHRHHRDPAHPARRPRPAGSRGDRRPADARGVAPTPQPMRTAVR